MKFTVESQTQPNDYVIKIAGAIDEHADFQQLPLPEKQRLILDLAGVQALNSVGLRSWVLWTRGLERRENIFLRNCPPTVVNQINILDGFLPLNATVESFQVPFHCEQCGYDNHLTLQRQRDFVEASKTEKEKVELPEQINCTSCQAKCEADIIPAKYFRFLRRGYAP